VFEELDTQVPRCATHPYLYAWYVIMSLFSTKVKEHWSTLPKSAAPQEAADYDIDLFSDDPQTEEAGNLEVSKYSVGFEIKPVSFSVNLDELAQKIMTLVACEGLKWCDDFEKVPIAYGLFKLQITCVILESVDIHDLIEEIMTIKGTVEDLSEDPIQSVDIHHYTKM